MQTITAYLRLLRWPNLLMVALTQALFVFAITLPALHSQSAALISHFQHAFLLLMAATLCITAASYAINDYYDTVADNINKPHKMVVNRILRPASAWRMFIICNAVALGLAATAARQLKLPGLMAIYAITAVVLWLYSYRLKYWPVAGNITVAVVTSMAIAIIWFAAYHGKPPEGNANIPDLTYSLLALAYTTFACLTSLVREIIKDTEDIDGDRHAGCRTIPIVWGTIATKRILFVLTALMMAGTAAFQLYLWQNHTTIAVIYLLVVVQIPLVLLMRKITRAGNKDEYHTLQQAMKFIMATGIFSMLLV